MSAGLDTPGAGVVRIRIAALKRRLGVDGSTIGRWVRAGTFPRPHYIGNLRCWFESEIEAWEAQEMARPAEARRGARNLEGES